MTVVVDTNTMSRLLRSWRCYRMTAESMGRSNDALWRELGRAQEAKRQAWRHLVRVALLGAAGWAWAFWLWVSA